MFALADTVMQTLPAEGPRTSLVCLAWIHTHTHTHTHTHQDYHKKGSSNVVLLIFIVCLFVYHIASVANEEEKAQLDLEGTRATEPTSDSGSHQVLRLWESDLGLYYLLNSWAITKRLPRDCPEACLASFALVICN